MDKIELLSWNVNGIRAIYGKGFMEWLQSAKPDILCIQETKAHFEQLPKPLKEIDGYHVYYSSAARKGYSGVALFSRKKPLSVKNGFGIEKFDTEGRIIIAEFDHFLLFNIYYPNGKASGERLTYKMDFYDAFLDCADQYRSEGKSIVICGDVNTAHNEIDLARPKENEKYSGFLPEERAWIDKFLSHGYLDTFRILNGKKVQYSWWDYKTRARERNIGWRIDYFFISENIRTNLKKAYILSDVMGSDHCPVGIKLAF